MRTIGKGRNKVNLNSPSTWGEKLQDDENTESMLRMKLNLMTKALPSQVNDVMSRTKLGKTLQGRSAVHAGVKDDEWCTTCKMEDDFEIEDSLAHKYTKEVLEKLIYYFINSHILPSRTKLIMSSQCSWASCPTPVISPTNPCVLHHRGGPALLQ